MKMQCCPLCSDSVSLEPSNEDYDIECETCGNYRLTKECYDDCFENKQYNSYLLRHYLYKKQSRNINDILKINREWVEQVNKQSLPNISEQADNLILWLGNQKEDAVNLEFYRDCHIIGSDSEEKFNCVIEGLLEEGLLKSRNPMRLSFKGWQRYEELSKGTLPGYNAFIAMQFNDSEFDKVVEGCFKPAVKETGFELRKLDDEPEVGIIDNIMRQKIKSARFIIADLSHGNKGSYWEAGYAEGLGKPVIYTCKESTFDSKSKDKPHFDANHCQTVIWDEDNLDKAKRKLKATIICSIPEAKNDMVD